MDVQWQPYRPGRSNSLSEASANAARAPHAGQSRGGDKMQMRMTELETRFEYLHRDLNEMRDDVKAIKARLAYMAGAAAMIGAPLAWIANSRMEQILQLVSA